MSARTAKTVFDRLDRPPTFEEVVQHIISFFKKQGQFGTDPKGGCRYISQNGNKCAVGCLLEDDEAAADWDRKSNSAFENIVSSGKATLEEEYLSQGWFLEAVPPSWMMQMERDLQYIQQLHDELSMSAEGEESEAEKCFEAFIRKLEDYRVTKK